MQFVKNIRLKKSELAAVDSPGNDFNTWVRGYLNTIIELNIRVVNSEIEKVFTHLTGKSPTDPSVESSPYLQSALSTVKRNNYYFIGMSDLLGAAVLERTPQERASHLLPADRGWLYKMSPMSKYLSESASYPNLVTRASVGQLNAVFPCDTYRVENRINTAYGSKLVTDSCLNDTSKLPALKKYVYQLNLKSLLAGRYHHLGLYTEEEGIYKDGVRMSYLPYCYFWLDPLYSNYIEGVDSRMGALRALVKEVYQDLEKREELDIYAVALLLLPRGAIRHYWPYMSEEERGLLKEILLRSSNFSVRNTSTWYCPPLSSWASILEPWAERASSTRHRNSKLVVSGGSAFAVNQGLTDFEQREMNYHFPRDQHMYSMAAPATFREYLESKVVCMRQIDPTYSSLEAGLINGRFRSIYRRHEFEKPPSPAEIKARTIETIGPTFSVRRYFTEPNLEKIGEYLGV